MSAKMLNATISAVLSAVDGLLASRVRLLLIAFAFAAFLVLAAPAQACTWYIKADGTGDAPSIEAGVDSALAGDTVIVASGLYVLKDVIRIKEEMLLTSECGPVQTKLIPETPMDPRVAIISVGLMYFDKTEIRGFWVDGFIYGISIDGSDNIYIENNIVTGNHAGIYAYDGSFVTLKNNTIFGNRECGIDASDYGFGHIENSIVWDKASGLDYVTAIYSDFRYVSDLKCCHGLNFSHDPEFCGIDGSDNYYLQSDSPCAPGNPPFPGVGLIGALPVECGTTPVEHKTWGAVKAIYRE